LVKGRYKCFNFFLKSILDTLFLHLFDEFGCD